MPLIRNHHVNCQPAVTRNACSNPMWWPTDQWQSHRERIDAYRPEKSVDKLTSSFRNLYFSAGFWSWQISSSWQGWSHQLLVGPVATPPKKQRNAEVNRCRSQRCQWRMWKIMRSELKETKPMQAWGKLGRMCCKFLLKTFWSAYAAGRFSCYIHGFVKPFV